MPTRTMIVTHSRPSRSPRRSSRFARTVLLAGAAFVAAACGFSVSRGQEQQPSSTEPQLHHLPAEPVGKLSSTVKLVTVYATVRDKHGKIVPTLAKGDFALDEDGRPQTISHFVVQTDVPLTLGLLVDTSFSQRSVLSAERDASYTFLDHMLGPKDVAFVLHFDREVELLQDLTSSRPKLQAALQLLETPELNRDDNGGGGGDDGGDNGGGRGRGGMGGGTHLYDAIYLASNDLMKKQQGRKAIFVLSDGVDRGSKESLGTAIEAAQRADTAVYTIYFAGEEPQERESGRHGHWGGGGPMGWPGGGGGYPGGGGGYPGGGGRGGGGGNRYPRESHADGKKVLAQISAETGGTMFEVSKKLPLDQIYAAAHEELRNQYSIGYTPNPPDDGPGYHKIHVATNKKDLTVQARDGYYSGP
jgi:VWFA-related protein